MIYLLAVVGAITVAVLLWRALGPQPAAVTPRRTSIAPDDDPEFLRGLGKHQPGTDGKNGKNGTEEGTPPTP